MADSALETRIKDYAWGRADDTVAAEMRSPLNRAVVRDRIAGMVKSLEDQLEDRPKGGEWRGGAIRLLGKLEDMLAEFSALCDDEATKLRAAIERHRTQIETSDRSSEEIDEELWAVLDG